MVVDAVDCIFVTDRRFAAGNRKHGAGPVYLRFILNRMDVFRQAGSGLMRGWSGFGRMLNRIVSPVVLGVAYFGILTPVALLYRLFVRKEKKVNTSFIERNHDYFPTDFENPW